jgi:hypothetical protein
MIRQTKRANTASIRATSLAAIKVSQGFVRHHAGRPMVKACPSVCQETWYLLYDKDRGDHVSVERTGNALACPLLQSLAIIGQRRIVYSRRGTMYICTSFIVQKGENVCFYHQVILLSTDNRRRK